MVVNSGYTGSTKFSTLRTEFSSYTGSVILSKYRIGNGFTANHENNSGLATTNSNLKTSDWWRKDKDYESNAGMGYTGSASWIPGSYSSIPTSTGGFSTTTEGIDPINFVIGTKGVIDVVGSSKSSTAQTTIRAIYTQYDTINFGGTQTATRAFVLFSGNVTGTWWTSITVNGSTVNRTAANAPTGTFDGTDTFWDWQDILGPFDPFFTWGTPTVIRVTL